MLEMESPVKASIDDMINRSLDAAALATRTAARSGEALTLAEFIIAQTAISGRGLQPRTLGPEGTGDMLEVIGGIGLPDIQSGGQIAQIHGRCP
jgi:hypothetical protein